MIRWVNGWIPVLIRKKNPPNDFRGFTRIFGPFCWINIAYQRWQGEAKYNEAEFEALLSHELQHASDFYADFPLYWFGYHRKHAQRLDYEARGYARQYLSYTEHSSARLEHFAKLLHQRYELEEHYSERECFNAIADKLNG